MSKHEIKTLKRTSKSEMLKSFMDKYKIPTEYLSTNNYICAKGISEREITCVIKIY